MHYCSFYLCPPSPADKQLLTLVVYSTGNDPSQHSSLHTMPVPDTLFSPLPWYFSLKHWWSPRGGQSGEIYF